MRDMLFGLFIEDLASRRFTPGNRNIVDDYLKRRGWRESVAGRRYLQQLRDSVLSLYEVVDVAPGKHCDLSDPGTRRRNHPCVRAYRDPATGQVGSHRGKGVKG